MNTKINTICFIILLFLLVGVSSAAEDNNETLKQNIEQPEEDICQVSSDNGEKLELSNKHTNPLEKSIGNANKLESGYTLKDLTDKNLLNSLNTGSTKVKIKAPDVKMYYKDGSKFIVTLKDENKNAIKKAKVKITIDGKTYTKTTDSKGKASLSLNQESGKYSVKTIFDGSKKYKKASTTSTVTIKSTIKCSDLTKYYTNKAAYYTTFYDQKGKLLKETSVKFKLNSKAYAAKTNKKGVGKLNINPLPGTYSISSINSKTTESITKTITIKTILLTTDLVMTESDGSKFSVKVLNSNGKASSNKMVILKVNGKTYTAKSNSNGIATLPIDLAAGKYSIITEYEGLKNTNQITVIQGIKHSPFSHITSIPNYVNVTYPYVFHNSAYALKTGFDGIIRMPKNELFTIQISETKSYLFSQAEIPGSSATVIGYRTHLIPFDGSAVQSDYDKAKLKGNGILIYTTTNYTNIEFRNTAETNTDLFGTYIDKGFEHSETITYVQNNRIKAKVNIHTVNYDEMGLKYNLGKYHGISIYDFNYKSYEDLIGNNVHLIRFANTGEEVTFNLFGRYIVGHTSKENIITRFIINGREELEKRETISYGLAEKYRSTLGFEVLQSYAIINEKITQKIVDSWISKSSGYLNKLGITNVYGMFMTSLGAAWMADELANTYSKEYGVRWQRTQTSTILGGINLDKTYLHVLNADMGMEVTGNDQLNVGLFKLINSLSLPELEKIALNPISKRFKDNSACSLDDLLNNHSSHSIIFSEDQALIQMENSNTCIIINQTSGIANVIMKEDDFFYKGASVNTINDCCSCNELGHDSVNQLLDNGFRLFIANPLTYPYLKDIGYELGLLAHKSVPYILGTAGVAVRGLTGFTYGLFGFIIKLQDVGATYRLQQDPKEWHRLMDTYTFTRSGFFQQKKVYNIPNNNGGYDYIESPIKSDFSLDRDNTLYISNGNVKKLTRNETYKYFSDDYYSPYAMPPKYWNKK